MEILKVLEAVATDEQKIGQLLEALRGLFQEADPRTIFHRGVGRHRWFLASGRGSSEIGNPEIINDHVI